MSMNFESNKKKGTFSHSHIQRVFIEFLTYLVENIIIVEQISSSCSNRWANICYLTLNRDSNTLKIDLTRLSNN